MSRYIDADKFERSCMFDKNCNDMQDVIYKLRDYPTADVRENVKGEWIDGRPYVNSRWKVCSVCHKPAHESYGGDNFCPNCGADMRGEA